MKEELRFPSLMPQLETEQLLLREIEGSDRDEYFALCSNVLTMRPYGILAHKTVEDTDRAIDFLKREFGKQHSMRFGIFLKANGILIGDCGFWQFDRRRVRAEAGAKIAPFFAKKGLMTEALKRLANYAFLELNVHAIEGNVATDNVESQRLVERLGFKREGLRRELSFCCYEQRFKDSFLYCLLKKDFMQDSL